MALLDTSSPQTFGSKIVSAPRWVRKWHYNCRQGNMIRLARGSAFDHFWDSSLICRYRINRRWSPDACRCCPQRPAVRIRKHIHAIDRSKRDRIFQRTLYKCFPILQIKSRKSRDYLNAGRIVFSLHGLGYVRSDGVEIAKDMKSAAPDITHRS